MPIKGYELTGRVLQSLVYRRVTCWTFCAHWHQHCNLERRARLQGNKTWWNHTAVLVVFPSFRYTLLDTSPVHQPGGAITPGGIHLIRFKCILNLFYFFLSSSNLFPFSFPTHHHQGLMFGSVGCCLTAAPFPSLFSISLRTLPSAFLLSLSHCLPSVPILTTVSKQR